MNNKAIMDYIRTAPDIMERIRRVVAPYLSRPTLEMAEESFGELLDEAGARMVGDEPAMVAALESAYMTVLREEWVRVNG